MGSTEDTIQPVLGAQPYSQTIEEVIQSDEISSVNFAILLESGDQILLESGDNLLLEAA
jgi:hypothetical protein